MYVIPRAKAPARLIRTNGFILGKSTLRSAGIIPHRLQRQKEKKQWFNVSHLKRYEEKL